MKVEKEVICVKNMTIVFCTAYSNVSHQNECAAEIGRSKGLEDFWEHLSLFSTLGAYVGCQARKDTSHFGT